MLDKKYNAEEKEQKWQEYWFENDVYKYEPKEKYIWGICLLICT